MISLTGDVATGKKMMQAAAKSVKRTHLELGGKAPVIVFDDADIDEVVSSLRIFGFYNAGQDCTAACRVYASDKTYEKLVADLTSADESIAYARADDTENEKCATVWPDAPRHDLGFDPTYLLRSPMVLGIRIC